MDRRLPGKGGRGGGGGAVGRHPSALRPYPALWVQGCSSGCVLLCWRCKLPEGHATAAGAPGTQRLQGCVGVEWQALHVAPWPVVAVLGVACYIWHHLGTPCTWVAAGSTSATNAPPPPLLLLRCWQHMRGVLGGGLVAGQ